MSEPGIAYGSGDQPGLPPVALPDFSEQRQPLKITINARPPAKSNSAAVDEFPEYAPQAQESAAAKGGGNTADDFPEYTAAEPKKPARSFSGGEAAVKGAANAASFGAAPAIAGLTEAAGEAGKKVSEQEDQAATDNPYGGEALGGASIAQPFIGAAKMLHEHFSAHPDPAVKEAYERGRKAALEDEKLAQEQHPGAYFAGQVAGGLAIPLPGLGAASTAARIGKGALTGGAGGALYSVGSDLSEDKDIGEIGKDAATGALVGAPLGGVLSGALGRRLPKTNTAGQRAAATAEEIGAPLPRGLASDSPFVQATAQQAAQIPLVGSRIGRRAGKTVEAAGERVNQIATDLAPTTDRAVADTLVRPGLQRVIDDNKADIDAAYNGVRSLIDQTAHFKMPRTAAALKVVKAARKEAGQPNPSQGLEQFENVANGTTFNGAHRARVDAREAGNALVPHPGYNAADFGRLTRAMTADIIDIVGNASKLGPGAGTNNPIRALRAFHDAERTFGKLSEQNALVHRLMNAKGEGAIATLLGAAKEKGGNLQLLSQLRAVMPQKSFEQVSGTLLYELGHSTKTGDFSLNQFSTNWEKISSGAKNVLFSPEHLNALNNIAELGRHLKGGDQYRNYSNTAGAIILWDVVRAAGETGVAAAAGLVNPAAVAAVAGTAVTAELLTRFLASPAKAKSMSAWVKAYRGVTMNTPTPARKALFVIATRNLANNLGVPANDVAKIIQGRLSAAAQSDDNGAQQ